MHICIDETLIFLYVCVLVFYDEWKKVGWQISVNTILMGTFLCGNIIFVGILGARHVLYKETCNGREI